MCDVLVALSNSTEDGSVIFAKKSDREPNEPQALHYFPRQTYDPDKDIVQATHIQIPQVEETYAVLLSSPCWTFGCEVGANEFGVTIGNIPVFTKEWERNIGLTGMDLVRLALERTKTAQEALEEIISLIDKHQQGGNCAIYRKFKYHNSFLIADPREAWLLETADRFWIAEKVRNVRTISNALTIGAKYDKIHSDLVKCAIGRGYCKCSGSDFHFANNFSNKIRTWAGKGSRRQAWISKCLEEKKGEITISYVMDILRSHNIENPNVETDWTPEKGGMSSICIHAKPVTTPVQTTGALISQLFSEMQIHWLTGTATTCTSLFKPFFVETGLLDVGPPPTEKFDGQNLWWYHEQIHRCILKDYPRLIRILQTDIQDYQDKWTKRVSKAVIDINHQALDQRKQILSQIFKEAFQEAQELERKWLSQINKLSIKNSSGRLYRRFWDNLNKTVNLRFEKG